MERASVRPHTAASGPAPWNAVRPFTRFVLWFDIVGLTLATLGLNLFPDDTAHYFAWTLAVPLSAGTLGVGYVTAMPSAVWSLRIQEWDRVRILPVAGLVLTFFIMIASFRDLSLFHLDEGATVARVQAWIWMVAYLALPPLNLAAWVLQDRAAGGNPLPRGLPLSGFTRGVMAVHAAVYTVLGLAMVFAIGTVDNWWPWPLTRLSGGAIGAWVLTLAAALWWSLRDGDWRRVRLLGPFFPLYFLFQLVSAVRLRGDIDWGDASTWLYLAAVSLSLALFTVAVVRQEAKWRSRPQLTA
jgi:hypothetical protein